MPAPLVGLMVVIITVGLAVLVMLLFTYIFPSTDVLVHGALIALAGSLLAFVLYLIFAMEHPFVGSIAVSPTAYENILDTWSQLAGK